MSTSKYTLACCWDINNKQKNKPHVQCVHSPITLSFHLISLQIKREFPWQIWSTSVVYKPTNANRAMCLSPEMPMAPCTCKGVSSMCTGQLTLDHSAPYLLEMKHLLQHFSPPLRKSNQTSRSYQAVDTSASLRSSLFTVSPGIPVSFPLQLQLCQTYYLSLPFAPCGTHKMLEATTELPVTSILLRLDHISMHRRQFLAQPGDCAKSHTAPFTVIMVLSSLNILGMPSPHRHTGDCGDLSVHFVLHHNVGQFVTDLVQPAHRYQAAFDLSQPRLLLLLNFPHISSYPWPVWTRIKYK